MKTVSGTLAVPLAIALASLALHLLTNGGYHVFRDEFYYIACGEHLAWGYVDHPPLIALVASLTRALFGDSLHGLRFFPAVAGALVVLIAGAIARDLGGGRFAQVVASLGVLVAPVFLIGGTILTMNSFELLWWTLAAWLLLRILSSERSKLWLALGVVAGVGCLTKHSMLFFLAGVFIGVVLTPARRHLRTPWPWLGGGIALAMFAPHLVWQVQHHWPTLEFMRNAQEHKNFPISPLGFMWGQVLMMNPLTLPVWLAGLGFCFFSERGRRARALGFTYLFLLALFVLTKAKFYYLAGAYPMLLGAGGAATERWIEARRLAWLRPALVSAWLAGGALLAPAVLPLLPPERLESYLHALHLEAPATERHRPPRLTQDFADQFGWEEMVEKIARAYHSLSPEEQSKCAIYAHNYGEAGAIDFYGRRYGLPKVISGHNSYWLWGPGNGRGELVITIGEERDDVEKTYRDVVEVDRTHDDWCMPYENDRPIFLGRGPKNSFAEIWPRCKDYI